MYTKNVSTNHKRINIIMFDTDFQTPDDDGGEGDDDDDDVIAVLS